MEFSKFIIKVTDKLSLEQFFKEEDGHVFFIPFNFSQVDLELTIDDFLGVNGKKYEADDFEKSVCRDLDF